MLCANGDIRLQGGTNEREGRIEICNDETWGTVCDRLFTIPDGDVACRQLGFAPIGTYVHIVVVMYMHTLIIAHAYCLIIACQCLKVASSL